MPQQAATGFNSSTAPRGWILPAAAIVAITALAYIPAMRAGFIWNDDTFLTANPLIQAPDGLFRFWFTTRPPDYFPLTSTTLWIEWRLWHMNAVGYHLVNVLLHAASAVLLWRVLARLRIPGAWLAGLIFAVHPVCVESVAWITERKNTLPLPLFLASLLVYLRFDTKAEGAGSDLSDSVRMWQGAKRPSAAGVRLPSFSPSPLLPYSVSLLLFLLALLAKTSVVMLPVVLLLCAWWRRGRISRKDLLRSLPFFALSLALSAVTVWFQYHRAIGHEVVRTDSLFERTAGAGWAAWFYLYKAVLPVGLCFVYPRWTTSASLLSFLPALILVAGMLLFWQRRHGWGRPFFFGLGYFFVMLLPVLGFLNTYFMRYSLVADHWQYAALIGLIALAAATAASWGRMRKWPATIFCAATVAALGAVTWDQCHAYRDDETLWLDTLWKNPGAWMAWNNLGWTHHLAGHDDKAVRFFDKAIALEPDFAEAYSNRAVVDYTLHRYAEALDDFNRAIALRPYRAEFYYNRAGAWSKVKDFAKAIGDYDKAISLDQGFAAAYYNRGWAYAQTHDLAKAIQDYDKAISLDKGYAAAYNNRGAAFDRLGRHDKAVRDYTEAIELAPGFAMAFCNRADSYLQTQRFAEAIQDYGRALALKPDFAVAYKNRAVAYYDVGEFGKAWADVKVSEKLGGRPDPEFVKVLEQAARRPE